MSSRLGIVAEINLKIAISHTKYSAWRIGLTHNWIERKQFWAALGQNVRTTWSVWEADSLADAQAIETYFINDKGMQGGTGGDLSPQKTVYVYIF